MASEWHELLVRPDGVVVETRVNDNGEGERRERQIGRAELVERYMSSMSDATSERRHVGPDDPSSPLPPPPHPDVMRAALEELFADVPEKPKAAGR